MERNSSGVEHDQLNWFQAIKSTERFNDDDSHTNTQVFSSHIVVFEPLGLLARKRQDLLATWSKIIHHCAMPGSPPDLLEN
jgi:hypothetical protein